MDVLILLSAAALLLTHVSDASSICTPAKCSLDSPEILPPFRFPGIHPHHCGAPGFDLFCEDNATMIRFPGYGDLAVKSISYEVARLNLLDPNNCVHEVFLNLNVSATPFRYYYTLKEYTYVNCSAKLEGPFPEVPCLSGVKHHVYIVESVDSLPVSCSVVRAVAIPFSYSPYMSDNSFGLRLTWGPIHGGEQAAHPGVIRQTGHLHHPWEHFKAAGMMTVLVLVMVGIVLFFAKIYDHVEQLNREKVDKLRHEVENIDDGKLLEEY